MRKSTIYLLFIGCGLLLIFAALGVHAPLSRPAALHRRACERGLVRGLGLTDLCLFTEAPYTRHPALADRFTAFQDHPRAAAHFPSGSLVPPPAHLLRPIAVGNPGKGEP